MKLAINSAAKSLLLTNKKSIAIDDMTHRHMPHQHAQVEHQVDVPRLARSLLWRTNCCSSSTSSLESSQASMSSIGNRWQWP